MEKRAIYQPGASSVEGLPTALQIFHNHPPAMVMPHWHAQVEVNYIMRGCVHYRMNDHDICLNAGDMCLFWGGQPHQMTESSDDSIYAGAHLPLVHFFRMRLPQNVPSQLMQGATLLTSATDVADTENFARWHRYAHSGDPARADHAVNELLLRIERIGFEPYVMISNNKSSPKKDLSNQQLTRLVARICDFIASNFQQDIGSTDIASAAGVHPKYAMSVFKKSTGMTLNNYLSLLRLSYAQAILLREEVNVLQVAMDSGFGSLSAFNKSFRNIAGMSPSDFRRDMRSGGQLTNVSAVIPR